MIQKMEMQASGKPSELLCEVGFKAGNVKYHNLVGYLDTGCQVTCISKRIADQNNIKLTNEGETMTTAKESMEVESFIGDLYMANGSIHIPRVKFRVINDPKFEYDMIIGLDVLGSGTFCVFYDSSTKTTKVYLELDPMNFQNLD